MVTTNLPVRTTGPNIGCDITIKLNFLVGVHYAKIVHDNEDKDPKEKLPSLIVR